MSRSLLINSLDLVEKFDGVKWVRRGESGKGLPSRLRVSLGRAKHSLVSANKKLDFDEETSELIELSKNKRSSKFDHLSSKIPKNSSIIEEYRNRKKIDKFKRNLKYMQYSMNNHLDSKLTTQILDYIKESDKTRREFFQNIRQGQCGSKELNLRRLKKKNTSFFTDEDFNQVGQSQSQMNMVGYD
ncbi:unnamed protein product [Dracunculus medinensis]|uniref:Active regulator of SIRT1 n=1 Tax=Dracunculus medinensis TaxID=318479 RepID=A0A0N4UEI4_DRAME|nr:unnamed protein product [Dracunculus medinensis]